MVMMNKPHSLLILICFILLFTFPFAGFGKTSLGQIKSKAKKIVMMLSIATKEYELGVENGKVLNAGEYKESLVFLKQANEGYMSLKASSPMFLAISANF